MKTKVALWGGGTGISKSILVQSLLLNLHNRVVECESGTTEIPYPEVMSSRTSVTPEWQVTRVQEEGGSGCCLCPRVPPTPPPPKPLCSHSSFRLLVYFHYHLTTPLSSCHRWADSFPFFSALLRRDIFTGHRYPQLSTVQSWHFHSCHCLLGGLCYWNSELKWTTTISVISQKEPFSLNSTSISVLVSFF